MTNRRLIGRALLGATALAAFAAAMPAAAQRVDSITAFGDSYADDGNAFQLAGINPVTTVVYSTGRFTGGSNFNDTLSALLGIPVSNFAIGGAATGNTNTNPLLPGFTFEVSSFLAGGGSVFPTVSGTFDEDDLITTSIGGNDARIYQQSGGTLAGAPAAAAVSVTNAQADLDRLVAAGAQNISFLAGNTALLPEIAGNASAQAIRAAFSNTFNAGIQDVLAGYAANGVIVHYLDLTTMLQQVTANLSAYGFTSAGPCTPVASCLDNAFSSNFVFYVDALHPTSHTSAVIAQYMAVQLQAPLTLEAPSELGLDTARQFGRTLSSRVDLGSPRDGDVAEGLKLFLVGDTFSHDVKADFASDQFDLDGVGVTAGLEYGFGTGTVGIAGNYSRPRAKFVGDVSRDEADSIQLGGFGGFAIAGAFAQGYLGFGWDDHDISRQGVVEGMRAKTDGKHWLAGAKAGYLMPLGIMRAGPVVAIDYAKAKVDGYTESGDPTLTLNVDSVTAKSLTGGIGGEIRGDFEAGGASVRPYLSAMLEKELGDNDRVVRFAQTTAPGIVNSWSLGDRSKKAYGRLTAGGSAEILSRVSLNTVLSTTVGRDDGNDVSAQVGLNVGF
ncbi:MAG TPA: autotransporter domain-containing protein [Sphingomicrobium sp.]|nr:autotransporter domain-containing protein [Sphingomicrobium sp.]